MFKVVLMNATANAQNISAFKSNIHDQKFNKSRKSNYLKHQNNKYKKNKIVHILANFTTPLIHTGVVV